MNRQIPYWMYHDKGYWKRWLVVGAHDLKTSLEPKLEEAQTCRDLRERGLPVGSFDIDLPLYFYRYNERAIEMMFWLAENCRARYHIRSGLIAFEDREDLMIFKLTWGGG